MMNLCKTCGTICPFDDERTECDAYAPMTNENWFCSLPTEEKAEVILKKTTELRLERKWSKRYIEEWLKEEHNG